MAKEGKLPRPQDKHLVPFSERTPEERRELGRKGGQASQKKLRERMQLHEVAKAFMALGVGDGRAIDPEKLTNLTDANKESVPVLLDILMTEYKRYKETGDKESRDFLLRVFNQKNNLVGTHGDEWKDDPNAQGNSQKDGAKDDSGMDIEGGVRIHLIRGEKPKPDESPVSDTATPDATDDPGGGSDA